MGKYETTSDMYTKPEKEKNKAEKEALIFELLSEQAILKHKEAAVVDAYYVFQYIAAMEQTAQRLASIVHGDQLDKSGHPYLRHVGRVAKAGTNWLEAVLGFLHDVVEDSGGLVTETTLRSLGFPEVIIDAVLLISRNTSAKYCDRKYSTPDQNTEKAKTFMSLVYPDKSHVWPDGVDAAFRNMRQVIADCQYMLGVDNSWLARAVKSYDTKDNSDVSRWGSPSLVQLGKSHKYQSKAAWLAMRLDQEGGVLVKAAKAIAAMTDMGIPMCYEIVDTGLKDFTRIEIGMTSTRGDQLNASRICAFSFCQQGSWLLSVARQVIKSEFVPISQSGFEKQMADVKSILTASNAKLKKLSINPNVSYEFAEEREFQRLMHSFY